MTTTRNPQLEPFDALVGEWTIEATHRLLPGVLVRGSTVFEWLEGEQFLIQRSRMEHPDFPDSPSLACSAMASRSTPTTRAACTGSWRRASTTASGGSGATRLRPTSRNGSKAPSPTAATRSKAYSRSLTTTRRGRTTWRSRIGGDRGDPHRRGDLLSAAGDPTVRTPKGERMTGRETGQFRRRPGPLVVSRANPRYFTVASDERKPIYLTGSNIWNNLHDGIGPSSECSDTPDGAVRLRGVPRLPGGPCINVPARPQRPPTEEVR